MPDKPNNFKSAALSHIPTDLLTKMQETTKVSTEGMSILEAIKMNTGKEILPKAETSAQSKEIEKPLVITVDGHVLEVPRDDVRAMLTMFSYLLATVWSKDPKVKKVLKAFNFGLKDYNGESLYPKKKNGK